MALCLLTMDVDVFGKMDWSSIIRDVIRSCDCFKWRRVDVDDPLRDGRVVEEDVEVMIDLILLQLFLFYCNLVFFAILDKDRCGYA